MRNIFARLLAMALLFVSMAVYATPSEIILLRHADKLPQKETGPALSSKGYVRSLKFANYILTRYGEPDFVIAGKPKGEDASIRELQTVGPLVNSLAARHPDKGFNILHPYTHDEHELLAKHLFETKKFNNKLVLICWRHTKIVELAKALGVQQHLDPWPNDDFDTVYRIKYDNSGKVSSFEILHNQYPLVSDVSWNELINRFADL